MEDLYYRKNNKKYMVKCDIDRLLGIMEELVVKEECPHLRHLISRLLKFDYTALDEIYEPNYLLENKDLYNEVIKYQDNIISSQSIKDKLYNTWELEYTLGKVFREEEKQPAFGYYERVKELIHLERVPELTLK